MGLSILINSLTRTGDVEFQKQILTKYNTYTSLTPRPESFGER